MLGIASNLIIVIFTKSVGFHFLQPFISFCIFSNLLYHFNLSLVFLSLPI